MVVCSFCGKTIKKGTGIMYVDNKGKISYFCSTKCKKYALMGRFGKNKPKWTEGGK